MPATSRIEKLIVQSNTMQALYDGNKRTRFEVNKHGREHGLITAGVSHHMFRVLPMDPGTEEFNTHDVAVATSILHDRGMVGGRAHHAERGAQWVEDNWTLFRSLNFTYLEFDGIRLIVRAHQVETVRWLITEVFSKGPQLLEDLLHGKNLVDLVNTGDVEYEHGKAQKYYTRTYPHKLPPEQDVIRLLELRWQYRLRVDQILGLLGGISDPAEFGLLRNRSHVLIECEQHMPSASEAADGVTLVDKLHVAEAKVDSFQSSTCGVYDAEYIVRDRTGAEMLRLDIQHFEGIGTKGENGNALGFRFGGLFRVAQQISLGHCDMGHLLNGLGAEGLWVHPDAATMTAGSIEFRYSNDPDGRGTCRDSDLRKRYEPYFNCFELVAKEVFGLTPILPPVRN